MKLKILKRKKVDSLFKCKTRLLMVTFEWILMKMRNKYWRIEYCGIFVKFGKKNDDGRWLQWRASHISNCSEMVTGGGYCQLIGTLPGYQYCLRSLLRKTRCVMYYRIPLVDINISFMVTPLRMSYHIKSNQVCRLITWYLSQIYQTS